MNLPNKLTMGRIFAIPVFIVVFLLDYRYAAAVIFILAALTDMLDGHIARKNNLVTNFGKLMDPLADKLLVMSALICLSQVGDVPGWMVIVILGREFIITGMRQVAAAQGIVIAAGTTGKMCIRDSHWLLLSTTTTPLEAAIGANLALVEPPAENRAMSIGLSKECSVSSSTV